MTAFCSAFAVTRLYNLPAFKPETFVLPSATNPTGSWLTPTSVLQPRFAKFSATLDF